jgi:hypothetical protein
MQHPDCFAVGGLEPVALEALLLPDGLQQALGGQTVFLAQRGVGPAAFAPAGVKIFGGGMQWERFAPGSPRSQADKINFERNETEFCLFNPRDTKIFVRRSGWVPARMSVSFRL